MKEGESNPYIRQSIESQPRGGEMSEEEKRSPYLKRTENQNHQQKQSYN